VLSTVYANVISIAVSSFAKKKIKNKITIKNTMFRVCDACLIRTRVFKYFARNVRTDERKRQNEKTLYNQVFVCWLSTYWVGLERYLGREVWTPSKTPRTVYSIAHEWTAAFYRPFTSIRCNRVRRGLFYIRLVRLFSVVENALSGYRVNERFPGASF